MSHSYGSGGSSSTATPRQEQRLVQDVLEGSVQAVPVPLSNTVRLVVSSDFSDTQAERAALRQEVYPSLRSYASSLGLQLQIVDPFHLIKSGKNEEKSCEDGVPGGGEGGGGGGRGEGGGGGGGDLLLYKMEEEGVYQLILKEIQLCHQFSAGTAFVTLLSQRYGYRKLQRRIPGTHFSLLCDVIEDQDHRRLVKQSYRLDENAFPPEYILHCRNTNSTDWPKVHDTLAKALAKAAKVALGKEPSKVQCYTASAAEDEITHGIFNCKTDPNNKCLWFKRTFTDLYDQWVGGADTAALTQHSDVVPGRRGGLEFDSESLKSLNYLKEARMTAKYIGLDAANVAEFTLQWQKGKGLDPENNTSHSLYVTNLCQAFRSCLMKKLELTATELAASVNQHSKIYQEVLHHVHHWKTLAKDIRDYAKVLPRIREYLEGSSITPLVVHGSVGTGKSTLIAVAVQELVERTRGSHQRNREVIISRFVGCTPMSCSIRKLLSSICNQISVVYKCSVTVPNDYRGVTECFSHLLSNMSAKPLCLFIDAVDQLSPEDGALGLSWLPLHLPPKVKIVISTSSETEYRCFPVLKSLLSKTECFVEAPTLTEESTRLLLDHFLYLSNRQLTPKQTAMVMLAVKQCPTPAYLRLIAQEATTWTFFNSRSLDNSILQAKNLKEAVMTKLEVLERRHGSVFVSHTLAAITAARSGLTEPEILDILSVDTEVLNEINGRNTGVPFVIPVKEVPPILWSCLLHDLLKNMLRFSVGAEGVLVLRCSSRYVEEAVTERYLHTSTTQLATYNSLANYFSGSDEPEVSSSSSDDIVISPSSTSSKSKAPPSGRAVSSQPLILNDKLQLYNTRKLLELPHSLSRAHRLRELQTLLVDYKWPRACNEIGLLDETISEFSFLVPVVSIGSQRTEEMDELRLLHGSLQLSLNTLSKDPTQFSQQLTGRLSPHLLDMHCDRPILKKLVIEALECSCPAVVPLSPFTHVPGGPLLLTMAGHRDTITSVTAVVTPAPAESREERMGQASEDCHLAIVSSSADSSLRSWDWHGSGVMKTFDGHNNQVLSVAVSRNGKYAASGGKDATVRYWRVVSGECLHTMEGHKASVTAVTLSGDGGRTVSGSLDTTIKVWNTSQSSTCKGELIYTLSTGQRAPILCLASFENDRHLVVGKGNGMVMLVDVISGEILTSRLAHGTASVTALGIAEIEDHGMRIVVSSEDCSLTVFDGELSDCLHCITTEFPVTSIAVGCNGKIVTCNNTRAASVRDIQSGEHLFDLIKSTTTITCVSITDHGRLVITGNSDATLNLWTLTNPPLSCHHVNHHSTPVRCLAVSPCGNFFISALKGEDSVVVCNVEDTSVVRNITNLSSSVTCLLPLRDCQRFLVGHEDGLVSLCDGRSGQVVTRMTGHNCRVNALSVSINSKLYMSGSNDGQVVIWSLQKDSGSKLKVLTDHKSPVVAVHFSQFTGQGYIISADSSGVVCIRDYTTGKTLTTATPYKKVLASLVVSTDGRALVAGYQDTSLVVLDLPKLTTLSTHLLDCKQSLSSIVALPDNKCLMASTDCTLKLWNLETSETEGCLIVDEPVTAASIHPRTGTIVYGCQDGRTYTCWYHSGLGEMKNPILKRLLAPTEAGSQTNSLSSSSATPLSCDNYLETDENEQDCDKHSETSLHQYSLADKAQEHIDNGSKEEISYIEPNVCTESNDDQSTNKENRDSNKKLNDIKDLDKQTEEEVDEDKSSKACVVL